MLPAKIDFSMVPVIDVATKLLGDENRDRSNGVERHFSGHSGLFVNIKKNRWYSHGNQTGGDAPELVRFVTGGTFQDALGWLRANGFLPQQSMQVPLRRVVCTYDYVDEHGEVLYHVDRTDPKGPFPTWRTIDGERVDGIAADLYEKIGDRWKRVKERPRLGAPTRNLPGVRFVPYRLPELLASGDAPVLVPAGEKDVDNLRELGFTATCNHGGEGKWWQEINPHFQGRRVFLLLDNDEQGEKHLEIVAAALHGVVSELRVVRFPELPHKGDVSDLIKARLDAGADTATVKNELARRFQDAPRWEPKPAATAPTEQEPEWPIMGDAAYHGLAGEVVKTIAPHSEADPVAILLQMLAVAGNIFGRNVYYQVESDRHHANLFIDLVGQSSKARKGTSYGRVKAIAKVADEAWAADRTKGGLSSGEGFINEVRDATQAFDKKTGQWEETDPGVTDKRLLIIEPEFAGALAVMERHGNTLSPLIRRGWDGDMLSTMTRNNPLKATGAHISIIGHITETELKARLTRTDAANGFANRFLFALVRRSNILPFGGALTDSEILEMGDRLKQRLSMIPTEATRMTLSDPARAAWAAVYPELSADKPGLLGAVTARAEAQTVRLAMIYALLDGEMQIQVVHLRAALAVWEYCEASAAHIFGNSSGDPVVDEIVTALKNAGEDGLSRNAIRDLFGRHQSSGRIGAALGELLKRGAVKADVLSTGGRPVEMWFLK